jgi:hypothetical protein
MRRRSSLALAVSIAALLCAACGGTAGTASDASNASPPPGSASGARGGRSGAPVPPPPPTPRQSLGPDSPPVVWLGGAIARVDDQEVRLAEDDGSIVTLHRLSQGATRFYRVKNDAWAELAPQAQVDLGLRACVETLMDGTNLVAIRVFLGAGCGPI